MTHPGVLLKREKLYAGKEMGQNFLSDPGIAKMIVDRTGIARDTRVLEIGPGLGALTVHIAGKSDHVTVVEKDRRLVPLLTEELENQGGYHVKILNQDILKTDFREIAGDKKLMVIGNLPYNISSQILFRLVKERRRVDRAFLMFQKELAARIKAGPGGKEYSRLSAVVQYAARVCSVTHVKPAAFFPRPDVDSTVLEFEFKEETGLDDAMEDLLFDVIKAAFSKRRKSLKNSLVTKELGLDKARVRQALDRAAIVPERRAETLSVEEFVCLARAVHEMEEIQEPQP
ncbi:16S rRNA (adenine(1518)-N(6)/adenine(1519)-N(6))-dimethyltransferase RsmA [Desulfospira joergensenii]|uniref:16S rRNA (adenine(1518)-N(6)/adenine(1519)-N(6))- dimethyltransferase RsmA n=1 Tax=Desulfospira joergensenii TaxID=53329 RepID=UPI0003B30C43|nr:16S rRNA (adenine(1518)-N(6)/adenine(1519)-N(6))-dimethyltransferase RsmA [Desulfospira joergensenii]